MLIQILCFSFFYFYLALSQPLCPSYCVNCTSGPHPQCITCLYPYSLTITGQCQIRPFIEGCMIYSKETDNNQCTQCTNDTFLFQGKCKKLQNFCKSVDNIFDCKECKEGYTLIGSQCFSTKIDNCSIGQFQYKNYCRPYQFENCLSQQKKQRCTSCKVGFFLINGVCIQNRCEVTPCKNCACKGTIFNQTCIVCKPENCLLSNNNFHCDLCSHGYSSVNGYCYKALKIDDVNCNVVDLKNEVCTGCNKDYELNRFSLCVKNFRISNCRNQFKFFDYFEGKCYYRDRFCIKLNPQTFQCAFCLEGYMLKQGRCERLQRCSNKNANQCTQCFSEFYLHPIKKICLQKPSNCLNFSVLTGLCNNCLPNTSFTTLTQAYEPVCAYIQQNCIKYSFQGFCLSCQPNSILKNGLCFEKPNDCIQFDIIDPSICVKCRHNYLLQYFRCFQMIPGCENVDRAGKCAKCEKGLIIFEGRCFLIDQFCLQIDDEGNCQRCKFGLIPYQNLCVFYQPFCKSYGDDRTCQKAHESFQVGKQIDKQQMEEYRIFVLSANKIKKGVETVHETRLKSVNDKTGLYSLSGIIQYYPTVKISSNKIMLFSYSDLFIKSCQQNFILVSDICINQERLVRNCKQYHFITLQCIFCQVGYDMSSEGACEVRTSKSCSDLVIQPEKCSRCNVFNGYFNAGGWCISRALKRPRDMQHFEITISRIMWPLLPNCLQQKQISKCQRCQKGFSLQMGKCVLYQKQCQLYHRLGACVKCKKYFLLEGSNCVPLNCAQFDSTNSSCISCFPSHDYQKGKCFTKIQSGCALYRNLSCVLCQKRYFLDNEQKRCSKLPENCAQFEKKNMLCARCVDKFVLYRDRCIEQLQYCQEYSFENRCVKCIENSVFSKYQLLENKTCIQVPSKCTEINKQSGVCQSCESGYMIREVNQSRLCVVLRLNCDLFDLITGRCLRCAFGYILRNSNCIKITLNCLQFNQITLKCTKCMQGHLALRDSCFPIDQFCLHYGLNDCAICKSGYHLKQGRCIKNPSNCQVYNQGKCSQCFDVYILYRGQCFQKTNILSGCLKYSDKNQHCEVCESRFNLRKDGVCYPSICQQFSPDRSCRKCPIYYKNSKVDSRVCDPFYCQTYQQGKECTKHLSNYKGGFEIKEEGQIQVKYCVSNSQGICTKCERNRYLKQYEGYKICYPENCQNQQEIDCKKCKEGYSIIQVKGACEVSNCKQYNVNGSCKLCNENYILSKNKTCNRKYCLQESVKACLRCDKGYLLDEINGFCYQQVYNCRKYEAYQCKYCQDGFYLQQKQCRAENCEQFHSNHTCLKCKKGFRQSNQHFCQKQYELFCKKGLIYDQKQKICKKIPIQNCLQLDNGNQCAKCFPGYYLNSNKSCLSQKIRNCLTQVNGSCKECLHPFILVGSTACVHFVQNCHEYSLAGCQSCLDGYTYQKLQSKCIQNIEGCEVMGFNRTCFLCFHDFYKHGNMCKKLAPFCSEVDQRERCSKCQEGYFIGFDHKCHQIPENCIGITKDGECLKCTEGYEVKNKTCTKTEISSSTVEKQEVLSPKSLNEVIGGVVKSEGNGKHENEQEIQDKAEVSYIDNCLYQDDIKQVCIICESDYFITQKGICSPIPTHCQFVNQEGHCLRCQQGFRLSKNLCSASNQGKEFDSTQSLQKVLNQAQKYKNKNTN